MFCVSSLQSENTLSSEFAPSYSFCADEPKSFSVKISSGLSSDVDVDMGAAYVFDLLIADGVEVEDDLPSEDSGFVSITDSMCSNGGPFFSILGIPLLISIKGGAIVVVPFDSSKFALFTGMKGSC